MRRFVATVPLALLLWAHTAGGQAGGNKPVLSPADYGQWQTLGVARLSPKGDWTAVGLNRVDEQNTLQLRGGPRDTTISVAFATTPVFASATPWVGYVIGVSPAERERLTRERKPIRNTVELRNLANGTLITVPEINAWAFSADGRFASLTRYAAEGRRTTDVLVYDLARGTRLTFTNVGEQAWTDAGARFAFTVEGEGAAANNVQVYDAAANTLAVLQSGPAPFRALAWRRGAADLIALQARPDKAFRDTAHAVLLWKDASPSCNCTPTTLDVGSAIPAGQRVADYRRPTWSRDGRLVYIGLRAREPMADAPKKLTDKPSDVEIWHTGDVRMFAQQKAQEAQDARRTLLAAWQPASGKVTSIGTDVYEQAVALEGGAWATETDSKAYPWEMKFGRNVQDVYAINLETGARTKVLTRSAHYFGGDPTGARLAWSDGKDYWITELASGKRTNLTASLTSTKKADFIDHDDDHPNPVPHIFPIAAWTKDGASLLVYDTHDLWRLPVDGSAPTRLTDGAKDGVQHRLVSFAGFGASAVDRAVDLSQPVMLSLFGRRTKQSGYARLTNNSVERLVYADAAVRALAKADSAPVYGFVRSRYDESPNVYVGSDIANAKAVTATNTFQSKYAWGKVELMPFTSTIGVPLQSLLYYPANYDPSKKYPLIVYTYERLTDGLHNYSAPNQTNYYNVTVFTQQGYFVLMPDIVFRPREPGLGTQYAVEAAVKQVIAKGLVDPARVGHVGHSQGGYEAAFLGTHSKMFATTIVGSGITDMVSFAGQLHWSGGSAEFDHWETGQFRMEVAPWEDERAMRANSPLAAVQNMPAKSMLLMVGSEDGTVDPRQGSLFYNYARRAGKQVVLLTYPGEGHGLTKKENQRDYQQRILDWFGHYLKGDTAATWITKGQTALERRAILDANKQ